MCTRAAPVTLPGINQIAQQEPIAVRAAIASASIVTIGLFLSLAAAFAFTPTWIGLGMLGIALVAAVTMVVADRRPVEVVR